MKQRLLYGSLLLFLLVSCKQDTVRRTDFIIQGIDVSHYQSRIDWEQVAEQDMNFAFVKATEGATYTDSIFCDNWDAIKEAQLFRGAYHFYRPQTSPVEQVEHFTFWVELQEGDLPPVLDVEVLDGVSNAELIVGIQTWLFMIELHYGVRPILYTNVNFYNKHLAGHFNDYPLWIARYSKKSPTLACGSDWQFWQYGSRGTLEGIDGYVDFNVFSGGWSDLEALSLRHRTVLSETQ